MSRGSERKIGNFPGSRIKQKCNIAGNPKKARVRLKGRKSSAIPDTGNPIALKWPLCQVNYICACVSALWKWGSADILYYGIYVVVVY